MNGPRIDAWLARHGVWFMPAVLGAFGLAMVFTLVVERSRLEDGPVAVLPHRVDASLRRGAPVPPVETSVDDSPTLPSAMQSREGQVEVCGVGWAGLDAGGQADLDAIAAAPAVALQRSEMGRILAGSGDTFARAVSWFVATDHAIADTAAAARVASASAPQATPSASPASALAQRLAEEARSTADPRVYAMAWRACHVGVVDAAACKALTTAQWARLDDGNAVPWLHALDEATRRSDAAARDEALFRIAESRRFDRRLYAAAATVADVTGRDGAALVAGWTLGSRAITVEAASPPPYDALVGMCRGATLPSAQRLQTCAAASDLLLTRSDTFDAWSTGAALARVLGRDTPELDDTGRRAADRVAASRSAAWDCTRLRRDLARWQSVAAIGEMAVLLR